MAKKSKSKKSKNHKIKKVQKVPKPRDLTILAAFKGEINLQTQVVPDKTKYKRKSKHKPDYE